MQNPRLALEIKEKITKGEISKSISKGEIFKFHDALYKDYLEEMSGEKDVVFKMKELWFYFGTNFDDDKAIRKILMSKKPEEYLSLVDGLRR